MASMEPDELRKIWDLSLYEQHRKPQAAITDNTGIAVSPRNLHSEFTCPICLGLLKKTMITKECLHRFCSDCLVTALISGNKECPSCRNKIVSKNSIRADPNFDLLISKIYPNRDEYEADQERVLKNVNNSQIQVALVNSMNEGMRLQNQNRHKRKKLRVDAETVTVPLSVPVSVSADVTLSEHAAPATTNSSDQATLPPDTPQPLIIIGASRLDDIGGEESACEGEGLLDVMSLSLDEIEIVFLPKPAVRGFPSVNRGRLLRYLKTSANSTVDDLSKFLATRYALECGSEVQQTHPNFCIYGSPVPGLFVPLNGTQNVGQVYDKFSGNEIILELFYSCQKT